MSSPQANLPEYPLLVSILRNLQVITGEDNIPRLAVDLPKPLAVSPYQATQSTSVAIDLGVDAMSPIIATANYSAVNVTSYVITECNYVFRYNLLWSFDGSESGTWLYDPEFSNAANTVPRSPYDLQVGSPMLYGELGGKLAGASVPWTFMQRPIIAPYFRILVSNATAGATFNVGFHYQFKQ